ncbi:DNA-binding response OmpR family regulator [Paenibacillus mucilaginosus]|uniref:response regulator transcription factor n=1 Tax=Paenibacillus mucilaginosus TaxID=61624 RepID=UPI003D1E06AB
MRETIILIDDHLEEGSRLARYLTLHGFEVICDGYHSPGLPDLFRRHQPALILLDLAEPRLAGLQLCAEIRRSLDTPLLFISSLNEDSLKIEALRTGGDDYLTRPFSLEILLARIQAHIRRHRRAFPANRKHLLLYPDLEVDLLERRVTAGGSEVRLSSKEFNLLALLAKHPNQVYAIEALHEMLWGESRMSELRTVMVHIYNLRQKIEKDPRKPRYIHTVRGAGYKFEWVGVRQELKSEDQLPLRL